MLLKNDHSPVSFPLLNPYGHVAFQAQRGDVHTVLVDGLVVKRENRLVGADLAAARTAIERPWTTCGRHGRGDLAEGDEPRPARGRRSARQPYTYTEYKSSRRVRHASRCSTYGRLTILGRNGRTRSGPDFVEALARGLDILTCFDARRPTMTLSEVAVAADLARPTARRLLLTLAELGYVRVEDGAYALTPRVLGLGTAYTSSLGLWEIARPHLEALVHRTGESSSMAQLDGSDIVYVARVSVPKIIALRVEIGPGSPPSGRRRARCCSPR